MYLLSCYIIKQFPVGHRVVWVSSEKELNHKIDEIEENLYFVNFPENHFDGKMSKIVQHIGLEDAGFFFSELILIGFTEGVKQYNKFLTETKFDVNFRFQSENIYFIELYHSLHAVLSHEEIWQICLETMGYGIHSLFDLTQEDVFGACMN